MKPIFAMQLGTSGVYAEVFPWGGTEKYGRRAIVLLRKSDAPADADVQGIGFDEGDPGRFFGVRMVKEGEEWQCRPLDIGGKSDRAKMSTLRIAAEAAHRLGWPLWSLFLRVQNELGWEGPELARVVVVSEDEARSIAAQSLAGTLTPAEA